MKQRTELRTGSTESIFQELKKNSAFDFNQAVKDLMSGKKLTGEDGVLTPLIKELVETALSAEVESHIANDALLGKSNRRNGYNSKTIKTHSGSFELDTPRDRSGSFEPQMVKKHQTMLSDEICCLSRDLTPIRI